MATPQIATRIRRGARWFQRLAYAAAALALLCVGSEVIMALSPLWHGGERRGALSGALTQVMIGAPALFFVWGLVRARRLFRRIEAGELFGEEDSRDFARIGWSVIGGAVWSMTIGGMAPLQTGALAQELASIGDAGRDLALTALGLALVVIGHVMAEARRLKVDVDSIL
jgi:hypothetical protein